MGVHRGNYLLSGGDTARCYHPLILSPLDRRCRLLRCGDRRLAKPEQTKLSTVSGHTVRWFTAILEPEVGVQ